MPSQRIGAQTVALSDPPSVLSYACVGGKFEKQGPLGNCFDVLNEDSFFGEKTWEKAESAMQKQALGKALEKAGLPACQLDYVLAGDLLNQCIGSAFGLREAGIPFFGLYGACSTMGESLSLAALLIAGGFAEKAAAMPASHFCTAEPQYRLPVPSGTQRPPTAQWTATAAGCTILGADGPGPYLTHIATGKIVDKGITDPNNMGAAMAPAAYDTLSAFFRETKTRPRDYDLILTGDLGDLGHGIVLDFFRRDGLDLAGNYQDCGLLLYDREGQDMHAGASGCGCSAAVLNGYVLPGLRGGAMEADPLRPHRGPALPHFQLSGGVHPRHLPRRLPLGPALKERRLIMEYLKAFLCGGFLCLIGQVLIDRTQLTPARILTGYVVAGVFLSAVGLYQPLVDWGGAGATVPLTGFGHSLAKGVEKAVAEKSWLGVLTGGLSGTAAGITSAVTLGVLMALLCKPGDKR